MLKFETDQFRYVNGELYCESTPVSAIVESVGTPVYIYSKNHFITSYNGFKNAFSGIEAEIFYAVKSNFNLSVIKTFIDSGAGVDVNSAGEFLRALKAGAKPSRMILTGVGKRPDELKLGLDYDVLMIKAESCEEVTAIDNIAASLGVRARVALRVNPDVDPMTHPYISTGLAENKFGIPIARAVEIYKSWRDYKSIDFTGIDMHIGSQITTISPFIESTERVAKLYKEIAAMGVPLQHFDLGGGIGVRYKDEKTFTVDEYASALIPVLKKTGAVALFEPGRYLTANGGILVTKIEYTKSNGQKVFYIVDAAINDLLRPSIYSAYHHVQPVKIASSGTLEVDIVGPVCESGDFFAKDREILRSESGSLLAVMTAGSYGMVMSSNYNARRRPPEVMVEGDKFRIIRSRETYDHMFYDEAELMA